MKRTFEKIVLPRKMTALFLVLVLLLPIFCFRINAAEEDAEPEILYEDVSKRGETEKHFVCSDGSVIAVTYAQEVHQPDGKGGFEDLDNRLILNAETGCYENVGNHRFSVSLATKSTDRPVTVQRECAPTLSMVTRVIKSGSTLSPELLPLNLRAEVGSENNFSGQKVSDATFELNSFVTSLTSSAAYGLFSEISSKYTIIGNGLKEDIILERNTDVVGFQTEYTVKELAATVDADGSLRFTDSTGKTVYSVSSPYVFDAAGSVCPIVSVTLRQTVSGYTVTYMPDVAWLSSDERVYPITFDPLVSNETLKGNRLTTNTYTNDGTTVSKTSNSISVGFANSGNSVVRTYTDLYIPSAGYPNIDTVHYKVKNMTLTLTVKEQTGSIRLFNYRLEADDDPLSVDFAPSGAKFSYNTVSTSSVATAISLPLDHYETGSTPTYLLMPQIPTSNGGTRYVSYYSSAETDQQKRPVLKVTYSLREDFDEKVCFIGRTDDGITRYLSLDENNIPTAGTTPYRWIFEEHLTGYGEYVIRSYENSNICLKAETNGTVSAVSYLTEEPSTECFWAPILENSACDSYLFYSNIGGGFLHLNVTDCTLTLSSSSAIDEHAWIVLGNVSPDVGNFTFENIETHSHLTVGQSAEQTVPARLTSVPNSYNETWIPIKLEDGFYRFETQTDTGKYLQADGRVLTIGTETDDSTKWSIKMDQQSGGYSLKNISTGAFLTDTGDRFSLGIEESAHLWKFIDFFALRAGPDDKVEFALRHVLSDKYLEYESIFSDTSNKTLTVEEFNVVVDETIVKGSGYTAQTRVVCQRFTFEKVGTGESAYYHILPLLRVDDEFKCVYRSEYRLVAEDGTVKVAEMAVSEEAVEDPTTGRWLLQQTAGGKYRIKNVATGTYLNVENNAVCLTAQRLKTALWDLKAISLAMEKDYQQYTNTCGAACGKMIVNYLAEYWKTEMLQGGVASKVDDDAFMKQFKTVTGKSYSAEIENITNTVNSYLDAYHQYTFVYGEKNNTLQNMLSRSLNGFFPAIINIKPYENVENPVDLPSEQLQVFGYGYSSDSKVSGHYFVAKGMYYNSVEQRYDCVVNETHYKFGETPRNNSSRATNNIGGRDLVVEYSMLYQVYLQRNKALMCVK